MKWIDVSTIMLCIYHTYVTTHHFNPCLHYYHILNEDFENMYRLELGESCPVFVYLFVYFFFYNFFFLYFFFWSCCSPVDSLNNEARGK